MDPMDFDKCLQKKNPLFNEEMKDNCDKLAKLFSQ